MKDVIIEREPRSFGLFALIVALLQMLFALLFGNPA